MSKALSHTTWQSVPARTLDDFHQSIPLFSAEGYHFFLPAFMLRALDLPNSEFWDFVLWSLPGARSDKDKLDLFSQDELDAVIQYLQLAASQDPDEQEYINEKLLFCQMYQNERSLKQKRKGHRKKKDLHGR